MELIRLSNGEQVDSRIYPDLQEMFDDARGAGYSPVSYTHLDVYKRQAFTVGRAELDAMRQILFMERK